MTFLGAPLTGRAEKRHCLKTLEVIMPNNDPNPYAVVAGAIFFGIAIVIILAVLIGAK